MVKTRNISIDRFRGIITFLMIFFQMIGHFNNLGVLTHFCVHAPNFLIDLPGNIQKAIDGIYILPNMTVADIIAPAFMFAIGLTFIPAYNRRKEKHGKKKAVTNLIGKYLMLVGIGVLFNSVNSLLDGSLNDGVTDFLDKSIFSLSLTFLISYTIALIFKKNKYIKMCSLFILKIIGLYGILLMLFNLITFCFTTNDMNYGYWNTLQHIGLSCIIVLLVMSLLKENTTKQRLLAGIIIFIIFSIFHESSLNINGIKNVILIDNNTDGGFMGAVGYSSLLLFYTVLADIYYKNRKKYQKITMLLLIPVILLLMYIIPNFNAYDGTNKIFTAGTNDFLMINKGSISPSYIIVSLFISSFIFLIVDLFINKKYKFDFFEIWGRSPILMYILEFALVGGVTSLLPDSLIANAPTLLALFICFILTTILTLIAYFLYKKNKIIKL